jgi:hypothetical protein
VGGRRQTAEEQGVPFLVDSEAAGIMAGALDAMRMGPGKPGPGDVWTFPTGPPDEIESEAEAEPEAADSARRGGLLHRLIRRG